MPMFFLLVVCACALSMPQDICCQIKASCCKRRGGDVNRGDVAKTREILEIKRDILQIEEQLLELPGKCGSRFDGDV